MVLDKRRFEISSCASIVDGSTMTAAPFPSPHTHHSLLEYLPCSLLL